MTILLPIPLPIPLAPIPRGGRRGSPRVHVLIARSALARTPVLKLAVRIHVALDFHGMQFHVVIYIIQQQDLSASVDRTLNVAVVLVALHMTGAKLRTIDWIWAMQRHKRRLSFGM